jgi:CBS-domain-containing membrane protein
MASTNTETLKESTSKNHKHVRFERFSLFLVVFTIMMTVIAVQKNFLLAPPYAVSAYLLIFERESRFSRPENIAVSYVFVIISSEVIHLILGIDITALMLNMLIVSAFISFTKYSHPPALALTIFSYIVHNSTDFIYTSLIVLAIIVVSDLLIEKYLR